MSPLISASSVTVTRDNKNILDNVSFDVGVKDFITILGPNGAGKSMLLKCLMGFFKPESGKIDKKAQLIPRQLLLSLN